MIRKGLVRDILLIFAGVYGGLAAQATYDVFQSTTQMDALRKLAAFLGATVAVAAIMALVFVIVWIGAWLAQQGGGAPLSEWIRKNRSKCVIILRGPPTAGKTRIAHALEGVIGAADCFLLHLDTVESDLPANVYAQSMERRYVIAEIYSGRDHLYQPLMWLNRYKAEGRRILSVCLDLDFRTGMSREQARIDSGTDASGGMNNWILLFLRFYTDPDMTNFAKRAGVREIRVDLRGKDETMVAHEILEALRRT